MPEDMKLAAHPGHAAGPWYVAPGGNDDNDCLSPATPCATINGAIAKANPEDTILVATGTYTGSGDEVVLLSKSITLSAGWNDAFTDRSGMSTVDDEHSRRGMGLNGGVTVTLEVNGTVLGTWFRWDNRRPDMGRACDQSIQRHSDLRCSLRQLLHDQSSGQWCFSAGAKWCDGGGGPAYGTKRSARSGAR